MKTTYRDLLNKLQTLSDAESDTEISVFDTEQDNRWKTQFEEIGSVNGPFWAFYIDSCDHGNLFDEKD